MEWVESLLKLLFGQLGPLGTTTLMGAAYIAWLHTKEREDHKETRRLVAEDAERSLKVHHEYIALLAEIRTILRKERANGG